MLSRPRHQDAASVFLETSPSGTQEDNLHERTMALPCLHLLTEQKHTLKETGILRLSTLSSKLPLVANPTCRRGQNSWKALYACAWIGGDILGRGGRPHLLVGDLMYVYRARRPNRWAPDYRLIDVSARGCVSAAGKSGPSPRHGLNPPRPIYPAIDRFTCALWG